MADTPKTSSPVEASDRYFIVLKSQDAGVFVNNGSPKTKDRCKSMVDMTSNAPGLVMLTIFKYFSITSGVRPVISGQGVKKDVRKKAEDFVGINGSRIGKS